MENDVISTTIANELSSFIEIVQNDGSDDINEKVELYSNNFIILELKELDHSVPLFILLADIAIMCKSEKCAEILLNEIGYPSDEYLVVQIEQLPVNVLNLLKNLGNVGTSSESYQSIYEWIINDDFSYETLPLKAFDAMFISANANIFSIVRYLFDNGCNMNQMNINGVYLFFIQQYSILLFRQKMKNCST